MATMQQFKKGPSNGSAHETMTRMFGDMAERTHAYLEKSLHTMQSEAMELMNRRLDHNGATLAEYHSCKDFADVMTAHHKWFADLNRDYYEAWLRMSDAAQRIIANGTSHAAEESEKTMREVRSEPDQREAAE